MNAQSTHMSHMYTCSLIFVLQMHLYMHTCVYIQCTGICQLEYILHQLALADGLQTWTLQCI